MPEDIQTQADQPVNAGETTESQAQEQSVKTFTQEEVTGLVAKESRKAQEKIFKDLRTPATQRVERFTKERG